MDIGSKLRETRQGLGLSIADITDKTLISKKYLVAIEENRFSDIPAEVMTLGFIRNYAVVMGLEPNELISEYKKENPVKQEHKINNVILKDAPVKKITKIKTIPLLIVLFSILLLVGAIKIISAIKGAGNSTVATSNNQSVAVVVKNHLEIQTTDNVWVRVKEGENPVFEGIIPPNTVKTFDSSEQFGLRIGNMSGISVSLNGKLVELPKGKLVGEIKVP